MKKIILKSIVALLLVFVAFPAEARTPEEGYFYSGQVASFRSRMDAATSVKALKARGEMAFYEKIRVKGKGVYFRVYVGKYASRDEALKKLGKLKEEMVIRNFLIHRKKEGVVPKKMKEKVTQKAVRERTAEPVPDEKSKEKPAVTGISSYMGERGDRDADYFYILGVAFDAKGNHEEALKSYTRAVEKDPKFAAAYNKRGMIYLLMGDSRLAIADHQRAVDLDPNNGEFRFNRGLDYRLAGQYDSAISDFQAACGTGIYQACDALRRLEEKMEKGRAEKKEKTETETGK